MKRSFLFFASLLAIAAITFTACKKDDDDPAGTAKIRVLLTDGPADYEAVNVEIIDVQVNPQDEDEGWYSLDDINPGVYDLLELSGGLDTLLAEAEIPAGPLNQIRLILGDGNTVQIDGQLEELKTPSAQQSGLKVKLNTTLEAGLTYTILLDFDAGRSVVEAGNSGQYILKPVIHATIEALTGGITGLLLPAGAPAYIYATNGADTLGTYATDEGLFLIRGVAPDVYQVVIEPDTSSGLELRTIDNVDVELGAVKDLGVIDLQ